MARNLLILILILILVLVLVLVLVRIFHIKTAVIGPKMALLAKIQKLK
jgi:hypothetical protein